MGKTRAYLACACGHEATVRFHLPHKVWFVACSWCKRRGPRRKANADSAIEAWRQELAWKGPADRAT